MSPILFFIIFFICTGVRKIVLQINSAAVAFIDILIAAWEGLKLVSFSGHNANSVQYGEDDVCDCLWLQICAISDLDLPYFKLHYM